ncbi:MAG TPA: tyrosine--tRNA ligase, partial [Vicingus sp.]|nr:tyrosine--tRNA ligase [Vicingus sp.]
HLRLLQKELAKDITIRVHSVEDFESAANASEILFKKDEEAIAGLKALSETVFNDIFEGVPQAEISLNEIKTGVNIVDALAAKTNFLASNGEARRALKENAISINKAKVSEEKVLTIDDLIQGKYILVQKGKKNYYLIKAV